jgi:hypothetical protein
MGKAHYNPPSLRGLIEVNFTQSLDFAEYSSFHIYPLFCGRPLGN